jgi:hypothetical protein
VTRAELIQGLRAATARVRRWPRWKKVMFERSSAAERYFNPPADVRQVLGERP